MPSSQRESQSVRSQLGVHSIIVEPEQRGAMTVMSDHRGPLMGRLNVQRQRCRDEGFDHSLEVGRSRVYITVPVLLERTHSVNMINPWQSIHITKLWYDRISMCGITPDKTGYYYANTKVMFKSNIH